MNVTNKRQLYEQHTQYRHWRFSRTQLEKIRAQNNVAAIIRVRKNIEEERVLEEAEARNPSVCPPDAHPSRQNSPRPPPEKIEYLSVDDELALCKYYETVIRRMPPQHFTEEVKATAITFMKRFYLKNTVMDYHPKPIMIACLFLAAKVENNVIPINDFLKIFEGHSLTRESIFESELLISQSLRFEYAVQHPYRAAFGLFLDLQTFFADSKDLSKIKRAYDKSKDYINTSLLTDLMFVYQPPQIALACVRMAAGSRLDIDKYIQTKFAKEPPAIVDRLFIIFTDIEKAIMAHATENKEENISKLKMQAREIDKKLHYCRNPAKMPNSAMSRKRRADYEELQETRRLKRQKSFQKDQKGLGAVFQV